MVKYIIKRIAMAIVTVFVVATLTFFLMNLVPGGPFMSEKQSVQRPRQRLRQNMDWTNPYLSSMQLT